MSLDINQRVSVSGLKTKAYVTRTVTLKGMRGDYSRPSYLTNERRSDVSTACIVRLDTRRLFS